jgi:DNA-binding NtrC family response regulator
MTASATSNAVLCADPADLAPAVANPSSAIERTLRGVQILIADDDPLIRTSLQQQLGSAGYTPILAADGVEAKEKLTEQTHVMLVDLAMPRVNGMECLRYAREKFPNVQTIVITSSEDVSDAVRAMKQGAFDYLTKPFSPDELLARVKQAATKARLLRDNHDLRQLVGQASSSTSLTSRTPTLQGLRQQIERIAPLESTVLVTGESGTGKSTIARLIHELGPRSDAPFVAVNCASLPRDLIEAELFGHCRGAFTGAVNDRPGRAEAANGGTLFLDEIGDLPLDLQPKLLTFLQDRTLQRIGSNDTRTVDVRLIVATHQDLGQMCQEKRFRDDLYYRLNVLRVQVPALRDRTSEIPLLVDTILNRLANRQAIESLTITEPAIEMLTKHPWPGNIRELENVLERAAAFCRNHTITEEDVALNCEAATIGNPAGSAGGGFELACKTLAEVEKQAIIATLRACDGNKAQTARVLGISEKSIYNKMRRHGLRKPLVSQGTV